jgi:hypothetical protein
MKAAIMKKTSSKTCGTYKRFLGLKGGRTLQTSLVDTLFPELAAFHRAIAPRVSGILGTTVYPCPADIQTTRCILIYENPGDGITWHYDSNQFPRGRFFTLLIDVIPDQKTCSDFLFITGGEKEAQKGRFPILFEGERVLHKATPLCADQRRVIVSFTFTTDLRRNFMSTINNAIKSFAFV